MTDPARQERIEAALRLTWIDEHGQDQLSGALVADVLEAADTIEPRPVYLTAKDRAVVVYALDVLIESAAMQSDGEHFTADAIPARNQLQAVAREQEGGNDA